MDVECVYPVVYPDEAGLESNEIIKHEKEMLHDLTKYHRIGLSVAVCRVNGAVMEITE